MRNIIKSVAISMSLIFAGSTAMGAGFALYEFSARGNAMAGAVMANKAEAASLAVNPALITQIEGSEVQVGATFVIPSATATVNGVSRDLESRVFTLPNLYATYQASENVFLGLAAFSRFGLGGSYGNYKTWAGSSSAYKFDFLSFSITPTIAARVTDELSLSMGLEYMYVDFSESKYIMGYGLNMDVEGNGGAWGGNFGAYYKPEWAPRWGAGLAYRTKTNVILDGTVTSSPGAPLPSGDVRGSVELPASLNFGVSFAPVEELVLEAGIVGTFWSSYDAIRIEYPDTGALAVDKKNYKDVIRLNFGGEYLLNDTWALRGGYAYDQSPTNSNYMDTLVPVGDRHLFNIGCGYKRNNWGVDLSYTYLLGMKMSGTGKTLLGDNTPMKFTDGDSHMIGMTFKYAFKTPFLRGDK